MTSEEQLREEYSEMLKVLSEGPTEIPMTAGAYEYLAREFDTELRAYVDSEDEVTPSRHILFHRPCFTDAMAAVRKMRKEDSFGLALAVEGLQLVGEIEAHCFQLGNSRYHQLSVIQAATNRALWQGAGGLLSMAVALRPRSKERANIPKTWMGGCQVTVSCISALRMRRNFPDELFFNDPLQTVTSEEYRNRMVSRQTEAARIINELAGHLASLQAG